MKLIYAVLLVNILPAVRNQLEPLQLKNFAEYFVPPADQLDNNLKNVANSKYFCPTEELHEFTTFLAKCLFEQKFPIEGPKQCLKEVQPGIFSEVEKNKGGLNCGSDDTLQLYSVVFSFCTKDKSIKDIFRKMKMRFKFNIHYGQSDQSTEVYIARVFSFCYDNDKKQTAYTYHRIWVPEGDMQTQTNDQDIQYDLSELNFDEHQIFKEIAAQRDFYEEMSKHDMRPQALIPSQDLIPYKMENIRNHIINFGPQWIKLFPLWNTINKQIRKIAHRVKTTRRQELTAYTGIFDIKRQRHIEKPSGSEDHVAKVWCKVIINQMQNEAIALLLHNQHYKSEDRICETNDCNISTWDKNITEEEAKLGYCCQLTDLIRGWFQLDSHNFNSLKLDD